jgi:hypothetical protein
MVSIPLIISMVIAAIAVGLGGAYMAGRLDKVIEQIGIYLFKAEAKAEKKKLEAQGLKEGEDFFEGKWLSILCNAKLLSHIHQLPRFFSA